tara:strand:- start:216 stop:407 length:192 start_codon:yes stop_codon:yes gene_type:complete
MRDIAEEIVFFQKIGNHPIVTACLSLAPWFKMEWLPPSPDGIGLCQDCGIERHTIERTTRWKI